MKRPIVLCLDDEETMVRLLEVALELNGYAPLPATTGQEALRLAEKHPLDAAILDYELSDINGAEVARRIKKIRPDIPILMFSGAVDISPAEVACVDIFVPKNRGVKRLLDDLQGLLRQSPAASHNIRRFQRYPVHLPLLIAVDRSGELAMYRGITTEIGEGGLGGEVEEELTTSEFVRLRVFDSRLGAPLEPRAQVRYRNDKAYGFEFVDMSWQERDEVRKFCELLGAA